MAPIEEPKTDSENGNAGCSKSKKNKDMKTEDEEKDWTKVLFEVIIKILTLGFYHIEKHRKDK